MADTVVLLLSSTTTDSAQEIGQRRLTDMLLSKKIKAETIDGSLPENKEKRDELFGISSLRGKYPQVFIQGADGTKFVGQWEKIQELVECDDLPADVLAANPTIETFSKTFATVAKSE